MKFTIEKFEATGVVSFHGEFSEMDLAKLQLDGLDRKLLDDVGGDEKATPADYLLALEMIFRRHAEQQTYNAALASNSENDMKQKAWYAPGGALVMNAPIEGVTGPQMTGETRNYYGASYMIGESMTESGAKAVAESLGLEFAGPVMPMMRHSTIAG